VVDVVDGMPQPGRPEGVLDVLDVLDGVFDPPPILGFCAMDVLDVMDIRAPSRTSRKGSWTSWG